MHEWIIFNNNLTLVNILFNYFFLFIFFWFFYFLTLFTFTTFLIFLTFFRLSWFIKISFPRRWWVWFLNTFFKFNLCLSHHSIFFEHSSENLTIFLGKNSKSFFKVNLPFTFILGTISVVKASETLSLSVDPVAFISVSKDFVRASFFYPYMCSVTRLLVIFPISMIL